MLANSWSNNLEYRLAGYRVGIRNGKLRLKMNSVFWNVEDVLVTDGGGGHVIW